MDRVITFIFLFFEKKDKFNIFLKYLLSIFSSLCFTMYLIGYFEIPFQDTLGGGYGLYKMNVLSIVNPLELLYKMELLTGQTFYHY